MEQKRQAAISDIVCLPPDRLHGDGAAPATAGGEGGTGQRGHQRGMSQTLCTHVLPRAEKSLAEPHLEPENRGRSWLWRALCFLFPSATGRKPSAQPAASLEPCLCPPRLGQLPIAPGLHTGAAEAVPALRHLRD